jgi:Holliday junction resolvasome RuvABC DNA-binding subunit
MAPACSLRLMRGSHAAPQRSDDSKRVTVTFRHAGGTMYGAAVSATAAEAATTLFGALRGLGFRQTEARRALASIASHVDAGLR